MNGATRSSAAICWQDVQPELWLHLSFQSETALPAWLNGSDAFYSPYLGSLNGTGTLVAGLVAPMAVGTMVILASLMIYVLALAILRRSWLAILAYLVIRAFYGIAQGGNVGALSSFFAFGVLPLIVLIRFGLLGGLTAGIVMGFFLNPLTFRSVWYAPVTYVALTLVAAIALYGFKTSLGGRRLIEIADT